MALPMIAAGIAARAVAKKLASRAAGGITGAGAKQVNPVYRNQGFSEAVLKQPSYTPKNSIGTGNVTKIPKVTKFQQDSVNSMRTSIANKRKSGELAKEVAKSKTPPRENLMFPPKTVKINSNPTRAR
jgi:hypothetical protein